MSSSSPGIGLPMIDSTEAKIGPYELHDFFLYHILRFGSGPRRVARLAVHAFDGRYDLATTLADITPTRNPV